ncbi:MAG TPA: histone deacetylase family protein [Nitrosomonas halophila]|nr:histone deacetylase family protein [Nitrosomonas halophila]
MVTAFITHPVCLKHAMGLGHPECPERLAAIERQLDAAGILPVLQYHDAPQAEREQLLRVHTENHVRRIESSAPRHGLVSLDPDTSMNPYTLEAAFRAAGAVILATDLVMQGKAANAFCSIRPPGHHATHDQAMGFCFFNNVAAGAAHAISRHGLTRVAIVDFDVHHGNGTEDIFRDDARVLLCSTFQHPFYPYSGAAGSNDHIINVPLVAGSPGEIFRQAVTRYWLPALNGFRPEIIYISAGFDAHRDDYLAGLNLDESDYAWVTEQIKTVADEYAQGRIISVLEGGYELAALGRSVVAHIQVLCRG